MNILAIDTSSKTAAVALYKDGLVVGECFYNHGRNHSVYIAPMIETMLEACGLTIGQIDYFACGTGPGSFTGVRIGVTMTKTFCAVTGKPCVGVDSLYALAYTNSQNNKLVIGIEDARRERVFACGVLNGKVVIETGVFSLEELFERAGAYNNDVLFVGGATRVYGDAIQSCGYMMDKDTLISGRAIGQTAIQYINQGKVEDCYSLLPKYLLKSQAEQLKK